MREIAAIPGAFRTFAAPDQFNNAGILANSPNTNALALRGLVIAAIILGLCIAGFAIVAQGGHMRTPAFIEDIARMMSSPAPALPPPPKKARDAAADPLHFADPRAGSGAPGGGAPAADPPPIAAASLGGGPVPKTAAQALHQVLSRYRNDPRHTATVTISSGGRITETAPGPLTAHDGLPVEALAGSTELSGDAPVGAAAGGASP